MVVSWMIRGVDKEPGISARMAWSYYDVRDKDATTTGSDFALVNVILHNNNH